jgi:SAM-dependent methyltransferase
MKKTVSQSRFWNLLWQHYPTAPSVALCRVPELEYACTLPATGNILDHCCGDGLFASLAWPGRQIAAGCDIEAGSIAQARARGNYTRLDVCDVSQQLPYEDGAFDLIFNNSGLEHVSNLDSALAEIARILTPAGIFAFNVLNHRYFEWWPLAESTQTSYRQWQPFYHALSLTEWTRHLAQAGLRLVSVQGYFDRRAARELAWLDYTFSRVYVARQRSGVVWWYQRLSAIMRRYWRRRLASLQWPTEPDAGAGYFIQAARANG